VVLTDPDDLILANNLAPLVKARKESDELAAVSDQP